MTDTTNKPKRRGRPRKFDDDEVLRAMTEVFWAQGYSATSLDMLSGAAQLARPSLYATFGDKEQMYLACLRYYIGVMRSRVDEASEREGPLEDVLLGIFDALIDLYLSGDDFARGCMAVCTASAASAESESIRDALGGILRGVDQHFEQKLTLAKKAGILGPETNPKLLGSVLGGVTHTLAVRARAGASKASLRALARGAVRLVFSG